MPVQEAKLVKRELLDGSVILDYDRDAEAVEFDFEHHLFNAARAAEAAPVWNGDLATGSWGQWGAVEYAGTFDGTPPKSDRLKVGSNLDSIMPPAGVTNFGEVIVMPGDQYGGSSGWRTLLRQYEPLRLISAGYDSYYVFAIKVPAGFPAEANLWVSGWEMHQTKASYVSVTGPAPYGFRCFGPAQGFEVNLAGGRDGARVVSVDHQRVGQGFDIARWQVFVFRYHHDTAHGDYELYYAQQGDAIKQVISAPNVGTAYEGTQSYPLFGLYRDQSGTSTSKMYVAGVREYFSRADALAWAAVLAGSSVPVPPPPPTPDPTTATSSVGSGMALVGATDWTVAVVGPATDVEFYVNGLSVAKVPVVNGKATYRLDPAVNKNVANGGFWVYNGTAIPFRSPSLTFTLTAAPTPAPSGNQALADGFATFKAAIYWHNPTWTGPTDRKHLPGYADVNPDEAKRVADWVAAVASGSAAAAPAVATKHGQGIIAMLRALST